MSDTSKNRWSWTLVGVLGTLVIGALVFVIGFRDIPPTPPQTLPTVVDLFGGEDGLKLISDSEQIDASLSRSIELYDYTLKLAEVEDITEAVSLNRDQRQRLKGLLLNQSTYRFDRIYGSQPEPVARFVFRRGSSSIVVFLSVESPAVTTYRDGKIVRCAIVRSRADVFAIVDEIFHDHPNVIAMNPAVDFFGQDGFDVLVGADSVEAHFAGKNDFAGKPIVLPGVVADEVAAVLSNPRTYDSSSGYTIHGKPYVSLRFVKGEQELSVTLCSDTKNIVSASVQDGDYWTSSNRSVEQGFDELDRLLRQLLPK